MKLTELHHLIAVVDNGSFTKAAEMTYVSQPTLSRSIKQLEEKLNVELFERTTRSLILTDAGHLVYEQANKIISSKNELYTLLDDLRQTPAGEIKIGIPPVIGTLFFPNIAVHYDKVNPNITLKLVEHGAKKIENLVDTGQIDIGLAVLPVDQGKFNVLPFIQDEFMLFVHQQHPLANRKAVELSELQQENFILFTDEFSLHSFIINHCEKHDGFSPSISYLSSQWDLIIELVSAQMGITLLPKSIYSKMHKQNISMVPIASPPLWELGIITKKDSYLSFAVRSLIEFLTNEFQEGE